MSTDNITPIRPTDGPRPPEGTQPPARKRRSPSKPRALKLDERLRDERNWEYGFDIQDVIRGLHGVCVVLDEDSDEESEARPWLESAARVLSAILHHRAEET